jgi:hypothetical protein
MAKSKNGGMLQPTPFNETTGGSGPGDYDESGGGVYHSWDEVMAAHLSMANGDMESTPNMRSGGGIMGGPAPGEPQVAEYSGTAQSKGSK